MGPLGRGVWRAPYRCAGTKSGAVVGSFDWSVGGRGGGGALGLVDLDVLDFSTQPEEHGADRGVVAHLALGVLLVGGPALRVPLGDAERGPRVVGGHVLEGQL